MSVKHNSVNNQKCIYKLKNELDILVNSKDVVRESVESNKPINQKSFISIKVAVQHYAIYSFLFRYLKDEESPIPLNSESTSILKQIIFHFRFVNAINFFQYSFQK